MKYSEYKLMGMRIRALRDPVIAQNLARHFAKLCIRNKFLPDYLTGAYVFEIETVDENGKTVFRPDLVLNSLYEQYGLDHSVERKVNRAVIKALRTEISSRNLLNLLSVLKYHLDREQQNKAVFKLEFKKIARALKKRIRIGVWRYKTNFDNYGPDGISEKLDDYNEYFSKFGYGFSINKYP